MGFDLYVDLRSPPCRAVYLAAKDLDLEFNLKELDLAKLEHRQEEYLKINPQHTVPAIKDGDFVLSESGAILSYLCEHYMADDDALFSKVPKDRAIINHRLYFNMGTLAKHLGMMYAPVVFGQADEIPAEPRKKLLDALELLDDFIGSNGYVAGRDKTIADYAIVSTIAHVKATGMDLSKYHCIEKWYDNCRIEMKGFRNGHHLESLANIAELIKSRMDEKGLSFN